MSNMPPNTTAKTLLHKPGHSRGSNEHFDPCLPLLLYVHNPCSRRPRHTGLHTVELMSQAREIISCRNLTLGIEPSPTEIASLRSQ